MPKAGTKKICVIRTGRLVDVICASAALSAVKTAYPDSEITFVVDKIYQDPILNSPVVDKVINHSVKNGMMSLASQLRLNTVLFRERFDLIIDLEFTRQSRIASFLAFPKKRTPVLGKYSDLPVLERDEILLKRIGFEDPLPPMQSWVSDENRKFASEFFAHALIGEDDFIVGMNIGNGPNSKSWPAPYFAAVGNYLANSHKARTIIFGGPEDRTKALEIYKLMDKKPMLAAGRTDFMQASALVEHCSLFISGDTGLLQIARGFQIPTIAIFGSTSPEKHTTPVPDFMRILRSTECLPPCNSVQCKYKSWVCLWTVRPETVVTEACELLNLDDPAVKAQFQFSIQDS